MPIRIIGEGIISPFGSTFDDYCLALERVDDNYDIYNERFAYRAVKKFNKFDYYDEDDFRKFDKSSEYLVSAAKGALMKANIHLDHIDTNKIGVFVGMSAGIASPMSDFDESVYINGPRCCDIGSFPNTVMCAPASRISILSRIKGRNVTCSSGSNSGIDAIGLALNELSLGEIDYAVCGSVDSLSNKTLMALENAKLLMDVFSDTTANQNRAKFKILPSEGAYCFVLAKSDDKSLNGPSLLSHRSLFQASSRRDGKMTLKIISDLLRDSYAAGNVEPDATDLVILSSESNDYSREYEIDALSFILGAKFKTVPILSLRKVIGIGTSVSSSMQVLGAMGVILEKIHKDALSKYCVQKGDLGKSQSINTILIISVDPSGHISSLIMKR